jgi:pilus assembly protein CpaF
LESLRDKINKWNVTALRPAQQGKARLKVTQEDVLPAEVAHKSSTSAAPSSTQKNANGLFYQLKASIHQKLIARIDLASAELMKPAELRAQLGDMLITLINEESLPINLEERNRLVNDLQNDIMGLGPLEPLLADPTISEIMINGHKTIFVERRGKLELSNVTFNDDAHLMRVIDKIVSRVGRRVDESSPMVDARLPDGSRVNAIIPPIALDGPSMSIRRFSVVPLRMEDLLSKQALTPEMAQFLAAMVEAETNIVISGGTGSGKTTLLNILSSYIPETERIVTIEDTAELQLQQSHVVRLETRPPNIEGKGEVPMRALVKNALRMRPDRIVLGEVRGGEVIDMLQAMNTGHDGSLTTIHANNPREALSRLENLVGMGGASIPPKALREMIAAAIHVIIQATRLPDGSRRITSITEITGMEGDVITIQEIFAYEKQGLNEDGSVKGRFVATGVRPRVAERIRTSGITLPDDLFTPSLSR